MNIRVRRAAVAGVSLGLLLASLVFAPQDLNAAKKASSKAAGKAAAEKPLPASPKQDDPGAAAYEQWLKKYGAYDRIVAAPTPDEDDGSGASALKRAEAQLLQGAPRQALAIIEAQQAFEDDGLEARRLWLGGNAHRALGDPYQAVIWYSQAGKLMEPAKIKARLVSEPGLEALWVDVWRRQFWSYVGNPSASREALGETLHVLLAQAEAAWGGGSFWGKAKESLLSAEDGEPVADKPADKPGKDAPLKVSEADRVLIARAVAAACLEDFDVSRELLGQVSAPALREFWGGFAAFLETGKAPEAKSLAGSGHAKAAGFWSANLLAPYADNRQDWLLGGSAPSWARFKASIAMLSRDEARQAVEKEMQSLLLSEEMSRLLRSVKLVLCMEEGDLESAQAIWEGLEKRKLPVSLRLAGALAFGEELKSLLPLEIGAAGRLSPALAALLSAGGLGAPLPGEAPFWIRISVGKGDTVGKSWPLDRLLVLSDWQTRWLAAPSPDLARRSAFLFPDTAFGYDCLLSLAQRAVENRAFQLADAYLGRMANLPTDKRRSASRLGLKAKMERESGQDELALASYRELLALHGDMDFRTRLDVATFLQLKGDFDGGREQLLILWDQRDKQPRALQAEVLFWLGEGEHSLRNYDAALDYYLRLAYQYAQEPMWPTVAMYRSAMIYEIKGNYETAKKLLRSVIATADTKEAQEAAKNRLNALETRTGKTAPPKEGGGPMYPF